MLKQLPFQLHELHNPLDLRRRNPTTGKMPVLDLDGRCVFDSTLILQVLDELKPDPPLLSRDPQLAAQQRLLEDWADESLYWYGMALRWIAPANTERVLQGFRDNAPLILRPLLKVALPRLLRFQVQAQGTGRLPLDVLLRQLDAHLAMLVRLLETGPFFFGSPHPSIADLAVFGQISFLYSRATPEGEAAVDAHPELLEFQARLDTLTG